MSSLINPGDNPWMLAAIFEVDKADRVQCQCKGCGHAVYRRVHMIVWPDGRIECWGGTCYQRELGRAAKDLGIKPLFTGSSGRRLTPEERAMLDENRERLIEWFREQRERALTASNTPVITPQPQRQPATRRTSPIADFDAEAAQEKINQFAIELAERKRARGRGYRESR